MKEIIVEKLMQYLTECALKLLILSTLVKFLGHDIHDFYFNNAMYFLLIVHDGST